MSEVIALAGWPPEVLAYAFAMYSRSSLSIRESVKKITAEKSASFFETYYFQYSHASIADNAHIPLALENIPEIAAFEIEDEQLWDGQERSTRYQLFKKENVEGYFVPRSIRGTPAEKDFHRVAGFLLGKYEQYSLATREYLAKKTPKPSEMAQDAYERILKARSFDIARYWLFNGIMTSVGQITSARTLAQQAARLGASRYPDIRDLAELMKKACTVDKPFCPEGRDEGPIAPTLMKHADPNQYLIWLKDFMEEVVKKRIGPIESPRKGRYNRYVNLDRPLSKLDEILASLIYEVTQIPYRDILNHLAELTHCDDRRDIVREVMWQRRKHDPYPKAFAAGMPYQFDVLIDVGGRRDLHRHRNCIQIHQNLTTERGYEIPELVDEMGLAEDYRQGMVQVRAWIRDMANLLEEAGRDTDYLIPFSFMAGTIYKIHLAEALYISELRSGVKGHFSYRDVACRMDELLRKDEAFLEGVTRVTPLSEEDLLTR